MPSCLVIGCTSGYASNLEKFHFFSVPKDPKLLDLWKHAVKRDDIKSGHFVCSNHFRKDEIRWQRQLLGVDGRVLGVSQYKIPRLVKDSVPSIFAWVETADTTNMEFQSQSHNDTVTTPLETLNVGKETENSPVESVEVFPHQKQQEIFDNHEINLPAESFSQDLSSKSLLTFNMLLAAKIDLPPGWISQKTICEKISLLVSFEHRCINIDNVYTPYIGKAVTVQQNLSVQVTVLGKLVNMESFGFPQHLDDAKHLQKLIWTVKEMKICKGCDGLTFKEQIGNVPFSSVRKNAIGKWQHEKCRLLLGSRLRICNFCQNAQKGFLMKLRRLKTTKSLKIGYKGALSSVDEQKIVRLRENGISKAKPLKNAQAQKSSQKLKKCTDLKTDLVQ